MLQVRHITRCLVAVALLATALALAAAPTGAQSNIVVFTFENGEEGDDADDWEVQITAQTLGNCSPDRGRSSYITSWLTPDDEDGEVLNPGACNYRITATARQTNLTSQVCTAELGWGDSPSDWSGSLLTSTRPAGDDGKVVKARHTGGTTPNCQAQPTLSVTIDPEDVVQPLPQSATDANLKVRAERAVAITDFRVSVTPRSSSVGRSGCDQNLEFAVTGDGEAMETPLGSIGSSVTCEFRITVIEAPPPFKIIRERGTTFTTADKNTSTGAIELDLGDHVQLPYNRIVIIQDVAGNPSNQGSASYELSSVCAGVAALPPSIDSGSSGPIRTLPGGEKIASLNNGRFLVHSPSGAHFGAGATYPAVASSTTSDEVGGCSVNATIDLSKSDCTLDGPAVRTLTWTAADPIEHFDFEFDINCGDRRAPATETPTEDDSDDAPAETSDTDTDTAPEAGSDTLRLVARLLENGKIEFGLQQRQHDGAWSSRIFPKARLFPTDAAVGRWLVSSAITLSVADSPDDFAEDTHVRIAARKNADGRVEFGLQQSADGTTWGDRMLPSRRYFPASANTLRWLGSSNLTIDG